MTEDSGKEKVEPTVKSPLRRRLIKAGLMGVAGIGATAVVGHEVAKETKGIGTDVGTFIPIYERHDETIPVERIPKDADILFKEIVYSDVPIFEPPLSSIIHSLKTERNWDKGEELLKYLAENGTEFMVGDVYTSFESGKGLLSKAELIAGAEALYLFFITREKPSEQSDKKISRRKFLRGTAAAAAGWTLLPLATNRTVAGAYSITKNEAARRVFSRLDAAINHLHPEGLDIFFRNLVMADKLLTVAEDFRSRFGKKPKIAFYFGGGHAGIEDFIIAERNFCRGLITSYPSWILKKIVDANGGIEDFSSTRIFHLPRDIDVYDIDGQSVAERKVTDLELKRELEAKLT